MLSVGLFLSAPFSQVTKADFITTPTARYTLRGAGANGSSQLRADDPRSALTLPTHLATDVAQVSAGGGCTFFITNGGALFALGDNTYGQLGIDYGIEGPAFIASPVSHVSTGGSHTCFIKSDGTLWAMGNNTFGQIGDAAGTSRSQPAQIATDVASVSVGQDHTLFLKTDGSLWGMGSNGYGQLGGGSATSHDTPVQIATGVSAISAGAHHSLFIKTNGSLWAMGENASGQLGDGSFVTRTIPVQIATSATAVSAGAKHTLFVKADHSLWAAGDNDDGQLGDGTMIDRKTPAQIATSVASVSAGGDHSLFVKTDRSLWSMGNNNRGQLFDGTTTSRGTPAQVSTDVAYASAGYGHSLVLKFPYTVTFEVGEHGGRSGGGALVQTLDEGFDALAPTIEAAPGWGFAGWDTSFSAIKANITVTALYVIPTQPVITTHPAPKTIHSGSPATLTVTATANAAVGYQWYRGETGDTSSPIVGATGALLVAPLKTTTSYWVRVSNHGGRADSETAIVTVAPPPASLTLYGWGQNTWGQLGGDSTWGYPASNPLQIATGVTSASAGYYHTLFVKADDSLWAMGDNHHGQLGDGTTLARATPVQVATQASAAFAGYGHNLFIKTDGSLWSMGDNSSGQLGDGSFTSRSTPGLIASNVISAAAGDAHSLFIKTDGSLWAMGDNSSGQLGDGSTTTRKTPVQIATGVASVAAGEGHTLFVKTDGSLWSMGSNSYGQLGNDSRISQRTPVRVASDVISVSAGDMRTIFVKSDGSLWTMGYNVGGLLGAGGGSSVRSKPAQIASDVSAACAAGGSQTLFIKTDDSLWHVAANNPSAAFPIYSPQQLSPGVHALAAGYSHALSLKASSTPPTFASWAASNNMIGADAAHQADPDGDGIPNLLEYAFGTSPLAANNAASSPAAIIGSIMDADDKTSPGIFLTHRRRKEADLTYAYQKSTDLQNWEPVVPVPVSTDYDVDGAGLTDLVTVAVPFTDARLFLRVLVSE